MNKLLLLALLPLSLISMENEQSDTKQVSTIEQYELNQRLRLAISLGDFSSALQLIDSGKVDINADFLESNEIIKQHPEYKQNRELVFAWGDNTPLSTAIDTNQPFIWRELLSRHARIDVKNKRGRTMLACAITKYLPYNPQVIHTLITDSRFDPRYISHAQPRILAGLLCIKRYCPTLPRDIRKFILFYSDQDIRSDALNCPMGLCKDLIHEMPFPALRVLIQNNLVTKDDALNRLTNHKLASLKPLMLEAAKTVSEKTFKTFNNAEQVLKAKQLLNPELLEGQFGEQIRKKIESHLGVEDPENLNNFATSLLNSMYSNCSIQ